MLWVVQFEMTAYLAGGALLWSQKNYILSDDSNQENSFPIYEMGFVWAFMLIVSIFWILNCNLLILHMYLIRVGLTTYEWLFPSER